MFGVWVGGVGRWGWVGGGRVFVVVVERLLGVCL